MAGRTRGQGRAAPFGLLALPPELQGAVLKHISSLEDKLNCARTCRCGSRCSLSFSGSGGAGGAGWSPILAAEELLPSSAAPPPSYPAVHAGSCTR